MQYHYKSQHLNHITLTCFLSICKVKSISVMEIGRANVTPLFLEIKRLFQDSRTDPVPPGSVRVFRHSKLWTRRVKKNSIGRFCLLLCLDKTSLGGTPACKQSRTGYGRHNNVGIFTLKVYTLR
jgi:hypothetical protein